MDQGNSLSNKIPERVPEKIRYFSKVAGSKFIMPDGHELVFAHGFYDLDEANYAGEKVIIQIMNGNPADPRHGLDKFKVYKEELEQLIRVGNPLLYKQGKQPENLPKIGADNNALSEAERARQDSALASVRGVVTGEKNDGPVSTTVNVNDSTIDPKLQAAVAGNSRAAEAAARRAQQTATAAASATGGISTNS